MFLKNGGVESNLDIVVDKIYPGMKTFTHEVNVTNKGEMKAQLSYQIQSIRIMDDTYEISDSLTSDQIEEKIKETYPFKINITKDDSSMTPEGGTGSFKIEISWDYESGDDANDTYWGNKAYTFYQDHPDENCIEMIIELQAIQSKT